ncbi:DNL zinc finger-domain-containing protein [Epithele typhae]|uniref:DNL zinc finger-domain-containing protein n=1 Tax=Epithele typhae TaxID=378194 RepID=UPI002008D002|nr:DNL zinc finger-domain-containing protein [Epithele typhae]KAH9935989.1 DNL zinc finger-domain-containing protein [Epithele typhae]
MSLLRHALVLRQPSIAVPPASASLRSLRLYTRSQLGARSFSRTPTWRKEKPFASSQHSHPAPTSTEADGAPQKHLTFQAPEPRLSISFTCTVEGCSHRSTHEFTKRSYTKGIVMVECPGCKNRHLIADNLGWFKESTQDGKLKTVEDLMRAKGEKVKRGAIDAAGVVEYAPE